MSPRADHDSHAGVRLRAAIRPSGSDSSTPKKVDSTAIWMLSIMPSEISASLSGARLRREHAVEEARAILEALREALPRHAERSTIA